MAWRSPPNRSTTKKKCRSVCSRPTPAPRSTSCAPTLGRPPKPAAPRRVYHRSLELDHPTPTDHDVVRAVVRGTRRQLGVAQPQKTALEIDALRSVALAPQICAGCAIARCCSSAHRLGGRFAAQRARRGRGRRLEFRARGGRADDRALEVGSARAPARACRFRLGGEEGTCPVEALRRCSKSRR
jgi:hypothetical protein